MFQAGIASRIVFIAAVAVLATAAAILVAAAMKPNTFMIERSIVIQAPPGKIFPLIDDFRNWSQWAPQDREDPSIMRTYSGAPSGMGAVSNWTSSGSAGSGQMSITESVPPSKVVISVDFAKPFAAHNVNTFTLDPEGASTKVTWKMQGTNLYFMKVMSMFSSLDRMLGGHFERGLKDLKDTAEK
jgi:uncharacterized protein YndB with AHSA1/START domain